MSAPKCQRCGDVAIASLRGRIYCHACTTWVVEGPNGPARPWLSAGVVPLDPRPWWRRLFSWLRGGR